MYKGDGSLKAMFQYGGEPQVDATLSTLTSFLPTGGRVTRAGMMIGENVQGSFKNQETYGAHIAGDSIKYGATGFEIGNTILPGLGGAIGAGVGAAAGVVTGIAGKNKQDDLLQEQEAQYSQDMISAYQSKYNALKGAGFSEKGNAYQEFRKLGGLVNADYEVEKGEVIHGKGVKLEGNGHRQLAEAVTLVGGKSHEQGGVDGSGGERVYSDTLKLPEELKQALKTLGIETKKNSTYADIAEDLGKRRGKLEKKEEKLGVRVIPGIDLNTRNMLYDRYNTAEDMLFQIQEDQREMKEDLSKIRSAGRRLREYMNGGKLPKYRNGSPDEPLGLGNLTSNFDPFEFLNEEKSTYKTTGIYNTNDPYLMNEGESDVFRGANYKMPVDDLGLGTPIDLSGLENTSPNNFNTFKPMEGASSEKSSILDKLLDNGNIYRGINTANYLLNRNDINKLQTDPKLGTTAPSYVRYRDRSGAARNRVESLARDTVNSVRSSSARVKAANAANILAKANAAISDINNQENARRDSVEAFNVDTSNKFSQFRDTIENQNKLFKIASENDKISLGTDARNAYLDGLDAQRRFDESSRVNKKAIILEALKAEDTGVLEHAVKRLGLNSIEELIEWLDS